VLHHVRAEQEAREGVERRGDSDPENDDTGDEGGEATFLQMGGAQPPGPPPAAQVDGAQQDERGQRPWPQGPGLQCRGER
jgi:hypothetical protein